MEMLADSVDPRAAPRQLSVHAWECVWLRKRLDWVTQWPRSVYLFPVPREIGPASPLFSPARTRRRPPWDRRHRCGGRSLHWSKWWRPKCRVQRSESGPIDLIKRMTFVFEYPKNLSHHLICQPVFIEFMIFIIMSQDEILFDRDLSVYDCLLTR